MRGYTHAHRLKGRRGRRGQWGHKEHKVLMVFNILLHKCWSLHHLFAGKTRCEDAPNLKFHRYVFTIAGNNRPVGENGDRTKKTPVTLRPNNLSIIEYDTPTIMKYYCYNVWAEKPRRIHYENYIPDTKQSMH